MCQGKMEVTHDTYRVMDVMFGGQVVTVDFNEFDVKTKKNFRVAKISGDKNEMINFFSIKPCEPADQAYLNYIQKEYKLMATQKVMAYKQADKNLSKRKIRA